MIEIITGDLLQSKEKYIAHQCNCLTTHSAGTAKAIFDQYPHADTYATRTEPDIMGSIKILGNGEYQRFVINMFAQYYPGKSKYPNSDKDGILVREKMFHRCLLRIAQIQNLESIAFPYMIGCNLGGGNWDHYLGTLTNFAKYVKEKQDTKVVLYKKEV